MLESNFFNNQSLSELASLTLLLLDTKSNDLKLTSLVEVKLGPIARSMTTLHHKFQGTEAVIRLIESECLFHFTRLNQLIFLCSGGVGKQTGEAITLHFRNTVSLHPTLGAFRFIGFYLSWCFAPSSTSIYYIYKVSSFSSSPFVTSDESWRSFVAYWIGGNRNWGVQFQSPPQTTVWVRRKLPSNSYFMFQDIMISLDLVGTSNISDVDFLDR